MEKYMKLILLASVMSIITGIFVVYTVMTAPPYEPEPYRVTELGEGRYLVGSIKQEPADVFIEGDYETYKVMHYDENHTLLSSRVVRSIDGNFEENISVWSYYIIQGLEDVDDEYTNDKGDIITVKYIDDTKTDIKTVDFKNIFGMDVVIGNEKTSEFEPVMELYHWNRETKFKVSLPDIGSVLTKEAPTFNVSGGDLIWNTPNYDVKFYTLHQYNYTENEQNYTMFDDGGMEFEVIFKSKPSSNIVSFDISSENLIYYYQPELTQDEIDNGEYRPENIIGSYAVYHDSKKNNNYKAGKAFHIYRPKIIDADGKEIWAELNIDNGIMTITIDQKFLDGAKYPVIVDPTFGETGIGASQVTLNSNDLLGSSFTSPTGATFIYNVSVYDSGGHKFYTKGYVVKNDTLNIVTNGEGQPVNIYTYPRWYTSEYVDIPFINGNTDYVLMHMTSDWYFYLKYDTGVAGQGVFDGSNSYTSPTNPTDATRDNKLLSLYCHYTDSNSPVFYNNNMNITNVYTNVNFSVYVNGTNNLYPNGQYLFSTNISGSWVNSSWTNFTSNSEIIFNNTLSLPEVDGTIIGYRWYADDNLGNYTESQIYITTIKREITRSTIYKTSSCMLDDYEVVNAWINSSGLYYDIKDTNGSVLLEPKFLDSAITYMGFEIERLNNSHFIGVYSNTTSYVKFIVREGFGSTLSSGFVDDGVTYGSTNSISAYDEHTVGIGWFSNPTDNISLATVHTNGTVLCDAVVSTISGANNGVISVSTANSSVIGIAWIDDPANDATFAVYDSSCIELVSPVDIDTNVGSSYTISIESNLKDRFIILYGDDGVDDIVTRIYWKNGTYTNIYEIVDSDVGENPSGSLCIINDTYYVPVWYDEDSWHISLKIYDVYGNAITGEIDIDTTGLDYENAGHAIYAYGNGTTKGMINDTIMLSWKNNNELSYWTTYYPNGTFWDGHHAEGAPPADDTTFTVSLPAGYTKGNFTPDNSTAQNEAPEGQTSTTPWFEVTNSGNVNIDLKLIMNNTVTSITIKADTDNNPTGATTIGTTLVTVKTGLTPSSSQDIWIWSDFSKPPPANYIREMDVNVSKS